MAIEYQLDGAFTLSKNLKTALLHVRGSQMTEVAPPNDTMTFTLSSPLVRLNGYYSPVQPADRHSVLFFRLRDKSQLIAGTEVVLRCVAAVLGTIPDDLAFWFNMDALLLRRRAGRVRYHEPIEETDKPFWTLENKALIGGSKSRPTGMKA
jgi:hypothetical protein